MWSPSAGTVDAAALEGVDAAVHLAGENLAEGRWTDEKKRRIRESRVKGTRLISETLAGLARLQPVRGRLERAATSPPVAITSTAATSALAA